MEDLCRYCLVIKITQEGSACLVVVTTRGARCLKMSCTTGLYCNLMLKKPDSLVGLSRIDHRSCFPRSNSNSPIVN